MSCGLCWAIVHECCDASFIIYHLRNCKYVQFILLYIIYTLLPCFDLMISIHAANPVGAVSEFIAQLQILELLDNVSNHAS